LVSLNGKDLIPETRITASFINTNKEIVGSSGCNRYSAIVEETDNTINFPDNEVAVTDRGCITPDGVMEQEKEYIAVLLSVTTFSVSDGQLEMKNGDGDIVLIFEEGLP
jgi:heat shock protein HslJ